MPKELIVNETKIGYTTATTKSGDKIKLTVLYGGKLLTPAGKELKKRLSDASYQKILDAFLESPEGKEYINPFEEKEEVKEPEIIPDEDAEATTSGRLQSRRENPSSALMNTAPQGYPEPIKEEYPSEVTAYGDSKSGSEDKVPPGFGGNESQVFDSDSINKSELSETQHEAEERDDSEGEDDMSEKDEEYEEEYDEEEYEEETERNLPAIILGVTTGVFAVLSIAFGLMLFGILPNPFGAGTAKEMVSVVVAAQDIEKGTKITEEMIAEGKIAKDEWESKTGVQYVDGKGTVRSSMIVLWDNRKSVVGEYAASAVAKDDCFTDADTTSLADGKNMLTLDVDGKTVMVPVNVTAAGTTDIKLYAIISSADSEGKVTNAAFNLSTVKLEGRELVDILNSGDKSILEALLKTQEGAKEEEPVTIKEETEEQAEPAPVAEEKTENPEEAEAPEEGKKTE